jgi:pimeloyl-ACP methyl ester carboxylesterase
MNEASKEVEEPVLTELPDTQYTLSGTAQIAYQVYGDGDIDLVAVGGPASHLEVAWEDAHAARYLERLGTFARVVRLDRRGTGLSDPAGPHLSLEDHARDLEAVMDAVELDRAALLGEGDAGRLCALFAATRLERTSALVVFGTSASGSAVLTPDRREAILDVIHHHWGEGLLLPLWAPSKVGDESFRRWWRRFEGAATSPEAARSLLELAARSDVRDVLGHIEAPTLVLHRRDDQLVPIELGRELARAIPGARFEELEGNDNLIFVGDAEAVVEEVERFLVEARQAPTSSG